MSLMENLTEVPKLEEAIERLLEALKDHEPDSTEYAAVADQLSKLYKLKEIEAKLKISSYEAVSKQEENDNKISLQTQEFTLKEKEAVIDCKLKELEAELKKKQNSAFGKVSVETWATIGTNLAGIILILGHERANVITSKAFGLLKKT